MSAHLREQHGYRPDQADFATFANFTRHDAVPITVPDEDEIDEPTEPPFLATGSLDIGREAAPADYSHGTDRPVRKPRKPSKPRDLAPFEGEIIRRFNEGDSTYQIANDFGVSRGVVCRFLTRRGVALRTYDEQIATKAKPGMHRSTACTTCGHRVRASRLAGHVKRCAQESAFLQAYS